MFLSDLRSSAGENQLIPQIQQKNKTPGLCYIPGLRFKLNKSYLIHFYNAQIRTAIRAEADRAARTIGT